MSEARDKELYVNQEDIDAIERFFIHFKFTRSKELIDAKGAYELNKTLENQRFYRFQLAKEIGRVRGQNELVDDLFKNVMDTANNFSYNMEFDNDLEEIIGTIPDPVVSKP